MTTLEGDNERKLKLNLPYDDDGAELRETCLEISQGFGHNSRRLEEKEQKRKLEPQPTMALEDWVISVDMGNHDLQQQQSTNQQYENRPSVISRVPTNMRDVCEKAYTPRLVSIGPFHRKITALEAMEHHKMLYLSTFLKDSGKSLSDIIHTIRPLEAKARDSYSEFINIHSDDFIRMMILDGCFIIELMRCYTLRTKEDIRKVDPIFKTRWMLRSLQGDLIMLENQIPFFILQELYTFIKGTEGEGKMPLAELTVAFYKPFLLMKGNFEINEKITRESNPNNREFSHILEVIWSAVIFLPVEVEERKVISSAKTIKKLTRKVYSSWNTNKQEITTSTDHNKLIHEVQLKYCASELSEAGLKFQRKEKSGLLSITSKSGTISIPPLYIDDSTALLFFNFLAYERCDVEAKPLFTTYFLFFDSLVNTAKDVQILHENGIIDHLHGSDEDVANLFNKICREIVYDLDDSYLREEVKKINEYLKTNYENRLRFWYVKCKRRYFTFPWTTCSLLAAVVLLILTSAQTLYSGLAYHHN